MQIEQLVVDQLTDRPKTLLLLCMCTRGNYNIDGIAVILISYIIIKRTYLRMRTIFIMPYNNVEAKQ